MASTMVSIMVSMANMPKSNKNKKVAAVICLV